MMEGSAPEDIDYEAEGITNAVAASTIQEFLKIGKDLAVILNQKVSARLSLQPRQKVIFLILFMASTTWMWILRMKISFQQLLVLPMPLFRLLSVLENNLGSRKDISKPYMHLPTIRTLPIIIIKNPDVDVRHP